MYNSINVILVAGGIRMKIMMLWIAALQIEGTTSFTSSLKSGILHVLHYIDCRLQGKILKIPAHCKIVIWKTYVTSPKVF